LHSLLSINEVVLFIMWIIACVTCTILQVLNTINDRYDQLFKDLNVRIVGISTDTHWTLNAYQNQKHIRFEMASDFNKEASTAYGILVDKYSSYGYNGVAKDACFLIAFDK
jgi:glutaredoxin-dependent peroxiredoxin